MGHPGRTLFPKAQRSERSRCPSNSLWPQPEMQGGNGGNSEKMRERSMGTVTLGVPRVAHILCSVGSQRYLGRRATRARIRSLVWFYGRWIGENQTGGKEASCYNSTWEALWQLRGPW